MANHLTWGPDGWLYGVTGSTATNRVRDHEFQQAVWRYHPRTKDFEIFCEGGGNLFGLAFDDVGTMFFSSNGGHVCCHGVQGAYYEKAFAKHGPLHNPFAYGWFKPIHKRTPYSGGPTPGTILLTGDSIPSEMRGSLAGADFLGHRILWWKIHPAGSTFELDLGGELFLANDSWSSPTDLAQGPDGSVYVSDFYDRRTAHPDPDAEWDRSNGRIYKIQPLGARSGPVDLTTRSSAELLKMLEDNQAWYRRRAAVELVARDDRSILPEVHKLFRSEVVRNTLEASWLLHSMDALDDSMLKKMLEHSSAEVRSWGVRLAGDQKKITSGISAILESMARQDDSIHVRSQLVATAGRLSHVAGISILLGWMDRDIDQRDPFVPWRAWWSLEKHSTTSPLALISQMTSGERPQKTSFRENLWRLARRYASGSGNKDVELDERLGEACAAILRSIANDMPSEGLESVSLGLGERGKRLGGMGMGSLYETYALRSSEQTPSAQRPAKSLAVFLERLWRADSGNLLKTRLAIQAGCDDAERTAIANASNPQLPESSRLHWIESVTRFGASDCSTQAMSLYQRSEESATIRRAALSLLEKRLSLENGQQLLATYSEVSPPLRTEIRRLLLR
ncbi:MAG: hypothetical protein KGQ60_16030, partial [Planctomycetes bacterium]|nr:hypothetical protein [Planctomycetota bacterium]